MTLDDMKVVWKDELDRSVRGEDPPMSSIVSGVARIDRAVRFRDFWMIVPLALGALGNVIFGWLAQERVDSLSKLGALALIVATTVASVALLRARRVTRSDDWTLRSRIEIEIERLEKQRMLLYGVSYWFLLPMLIAIGLSSLGGYHGRTGTYVPNATLWAYYAGCSVLYGTTYWLVRREVKEKWEPVLARLRGLHADLLGTGGAPVGTKEQL